VIVAEGAGSIAEINLHDRDLANVECARFADAAIVIAVDIERGGAFASLYGTLLELLPDDVRERVAGAVITKFRGDPALLEPGIEEIEARTRSRSSASSRTTTPSSRPRTVSLPDADGEGGPGVSGTDDGVPEEETVRIAVPGSRASRTSPI